MKALRIMGWTVVGILIFLLLISVVAYHTLAIDEPDSTPTIQGKWAWRNVLEDDDILIIIYENTPYATEPDTPYSEAFVWRLLDTDGTTEIGQALGYDYFDSGYGYNVIGFYFSAADNVTWGENYYIKLSGTPAAFEEPPEYVFQMTSSDYSDLTDSDEVQDDIEARIIEIAADLDNKWGLTTDYALLEQSELGMVLSIYGEAFFRGALYGLQAYAPEVFRLIISNIDEEMLTDRSWETEYAGNLTSQFPGTSIEEGMEAGNEFLGVDYNLFGLLITLGLIAVITVAGLVIGGDWWGSVAGAVAPIVIMTRMGMFGMGELALVAALCFLFFSAKMWKLI